MSRYYYCSGNWPSFGPADFFGGTRTFDMIGGEGGGFFSTWLIYSQFHRSRCSIVHVHIVHELFFFLLRLDLFFARFIAAFRVIYASHVCASNDCSGVDC
mgnify:CR=1 FL=1